MREFNENILESLDDGLVLMPAGRSCAGTERSSRRQGLGPTPSACHSEIFERTVRRRAGRPRGEPTRRRSSRCR